jgi:hypothetical protein
VLKMVGNKWRSIVLCIARESLSLNRHLIFCSVEACFAQHYVRSLQLRAYPNLPLKIIVAWLIKVVRLKG